MLNKAYAIVILEINGQSLIEYELIVSLISISAILLMIVFGEQIFDFYEEIVSQISNLIN